MTNMATTALVPRDIDRVTAAAVRRLREAAGLSRASLAQQAGISPKSLQRYETLERGVPLQDLARLEEILGPCRPVPVVSPVNQGDPLTLAERRLLAIFRKLSPEAQEALVGRAYLLMNDGEPPPTDEQDRSALQRVDKRSVRS